MKFLRILAAAFLAAMGPAVLANAGEKSVAVFDATLIDTSTEGAINGVREDESARLAAVSEQLRAAFEDAGYTIVPLDPVRETLDRTLNPAQCNNCELRMGETLGADLVVTSEVQKVSNLILAFNVVVRDVGSGERVRVGSADIRGNTDRSWERGLSYLLRHRILKVKP